MCGRRLAGEVDLPQGRGWKSLEGEASWLGKESKALGLVAHSLVGRGPVLTVTGIAC
jgi:hypothetical protein